MAEAYKKLGKATPAATTLTDLYAVPSGKSAVISAVYVCNRSATPTTFRLSHSDAGAADATDQYQYYDVPIGGNDTIQVMQGVTMAATDKLRCYAVLATLTFSAFGTEIT